MRFSGSARREKFAFVFSMRLGGRVPGTERQGGDFAEQSEFGAFIASIAPIPKIKGNFEEH